MNASTGCAGCPFQRDELTGWGRLDVAAAVAPGADGSRAARRPFEPNDDAGDGAVRLWGPRGRTVSATLDFWDDQTRRLRVHLRQRERVYASLRGAGGRAADPVEARDDRRSTASRSACGGARSSSPGSAESTSGSRSARRARHGGWYYLQVKSEAEGGGAYTLSFAKTGVLQRARR